MSHSLRCRQASITRNLAILATCQGAFGVVAALCASRKKKRPNRSRQPAKYHRAALLSSSLIQFETPWRRLWRLGSDDDFLVSVNFPSAIVKNRILPLFQAQRAALNFGRPYRRGRKSRGGAPTYGDNRYSWSGVVVFEIVWDSAISEPNIWYCTEHGRCVVGLLPTGPI